MKYANLSIRIAVLTALAAILCVPAFSQGCALCYSQAASAGHKMIEALRSGILILVLPPTAASVGLLFIVHRKRNQIRRPADGDTPDDWGK